MKQLGVAELRKALEVLEAAKPKCWCGEPARYVQWWAIERPTEAPDWDGRCTKHRYT